MTLRTSLVLGLAVALLTSTAVSARSVRNANSPVEFAKCSLKIKGQPSRSGPCSTQAKGNDYLIEMGAARYMISTPEEEPTEGGFLTYPDKKPLDFVVGDGACWEGEKVKFCARN